MARQISKRRRKRRKFNGPRGRHSAYAKKRYQAADASIHQRLRHILNEGKPRPYKICRMTTIFVPVEQTVVKSVRRTTKVNTTTPTCSVQGNPKCASSKAGESEDPVAQTTRRRRRTCTKFVGRRIQHEWCVDEATGETKWYIGTVLEVIKGKDGHPSAIYEILYDGEDEPQQVDNLHEDLNGGSVKFVDL
ncbi:hypothetical protein KP79_PYT19098 [Mizuhopecten yessoensis]|uniref:Uncharacterized protein n=1 Tax=Mizuhopecten yessoensis TaxID=6573 RepID=A0A210PT94_MIZYE|nr:hypothetical protein KP79_PYT19098 [Mizuhopecten yessoensis]